MSQTGIKIEEHVPLAPMTTLKVGGTARYYAPVATVDEIREAVLFAKNKQVPIVVLAGGSNVLIEDGELTALVLHPSCDTSSYEYDGEKVHVCVDAGKSLDSLIVELIGKEIWGLENLSGIPGTVGATPIQNVGAYGREVSDVISSVDVYDIETDEERTFTNAECAFGYRDSIFKHEIKHRYIVLRVHFNLTKKSTPLLSYNDLERYFKEKEEPTQQEIRDAILDIRSKKFPDWHAVGTAGSFFKNPIITEEAFTQLRGKYPLLPGFQMFDGGIKIPLGYVLDKVLGLKGFVRGNVGLYEQQALVLVAKGGATSKEVIEFANEIIFRVKKETDLAVEFEVTRIE